MIERADLKSLKNYNSFGIDVQAKEIVFLKDTKDLESIEDRDKALILGGGSNVLFTSNLEQTVIVNKTAGIKENFISDHEVELTIASGENWHDVVLFAVSKNYGGIENLSLIPGSTGAAPMQNIGAYGVEIKDVLVEVEAIHIDSLEKRIFSNSECEFGYRDSIFKTREKGNYFISSICLRLSRKNHNLNTSYGAIKDVLGEKNINNPNIKEISDAVIEIRRSKLPDPNELGNAGSFFKNPVISKEQYASLKEQFPDIVGYPLDKQRIKVPAGWLIESLGWKGKVIGNTGSHKQQALVLVNYGNATGSEIKQLSEDIMDSVLNKYQIQLEREVNIIE